MATAAIARIGALARLTLPAVATVLLVLVAALPWGIPHMPALEPVLAIISVYYWGVYRPDLMPAGAAFLIGLVVDLLGGSPLGLTAIVLVLVQATAIGQRRALIGKSFAVGWLGYALISAGAAVIGWLLNCLFYGQFIHGTPTVINYAAGLMLYPGLALVLWRMQQIVRPA